ncbi:hypothetical protein Sjap_008372 [Stephania japonica]|uniref:Uncharacterized protein n=1 Tax=Stephania japonica TaxID=461633 RepID=A0AAP0JQY8_9MAGN
MNLIEQELDQWIEQRDQEAEEEIKSILQKISAETMSAISLESTEVNEVTPVEDCWSEPEETLVISLHEPYIEIAQSTYEEVEKDIEVILERLEEPQKDSKEDQPLSFLPPKASHTYMPNKTHRIHAAKRFFRLHVLAALKSRGGYVKGSVVATYAEMCVKSDCKKVPCSSRVWEEVSPA